ncbi:NLR family CARD domain-containing protein 3 [Labeo rohita]|uniref:NLR family CARD domain-containing protein 3 n=1 Tax=Labeo rohita TaxID=84645 RepID=A0ABQ8M1C9_LABRO|nr:NLR family CARD domain-containing protein 3 [Labeo rohita]
MNESFKNDPSLLLAIVGVLQHRKRKNCIKENLPKLSHVPVKRYYSGDQLILSSGGNTGRCCEILKLSRSNLKNKFQCLYEGITKQGNPTLLNEIYTELYITESESGEISNEHEVRQIETQSRRAATEDTPIKCSDIFTPSPGQDKPIRTVLTKGVAGIGKTVSVQKFILDWAEGKENQDVQLIFPLPFRELNLMKDKTLSLVDLLHVFFPETKKIEMDYDKYKVLFIFDGLDECRLPLHFKRNKTLWDANKKKSVDVLLTNLIVGNLLPSALIWITSRPAAADLIPSECVHRVTEVRGFNDPQKEEYFRKRISGQRLANRIISHLKSSRSLYIMCHIPVFCWISATVLEKMLIQAESGEIPKTLTQMYTHFLILQTNIKHEKDYEKNVTDEDIILKLGKLAFQQLVKGNLIFYEEDLRECGIDVTEASVYSGLCTQIFREEFGLYQGKVFSFVHLSIQEHLAALYVHLSFTNYSSRVFSSVFSDLSMFFIYTLSELHQRAVNEALQSKNGHLDLFLRFLLGLSVESHQILLQELMKQRRSSSDSNKETVDYIKMKIRTIDSPEKSINLFHCLNELGDHSLVEEIQQYLTSGQITLSSNPSHLRELNLSENKIGDSGVLSLSSGFESPHCNLEILRLACCGLTEKGCAALDSILKSNPSHLRELNLTENKLGDSGVVRLSSGLKNPHCKLEILRLSDCGVRDHGCEALASALSSNSSHLRELDLSENKLGDSGVKFLSSGLINPHCKLEILRLSDCGVTDKGCDALTSALKSNLRELDLSWNKVGDSDKLSLSVDEKVDLGSESTMSCLGYELRSLCAEMLLTKLHSYVTKLEFFGYRDVAYVWRKEEYNAVGMFQCVWHWNLIRKISKGRRKEDFEKILKGNFGSLQQNLHDNNPKRTSFLVKNYFQMSKVNILDWPALLSDCGVTDEGCVALASALSSNSPHLKELKLSANKLGDSGVMHLSSGLMNPYCELEILWLNYCGVTDEGCTALASALSSNPSYLKELNLHGNILRDSGCKLLTDLKNSPQYKLEKLMQSQGASSPLARRRGLIWFPWSCADGRLGDEVFTGDPSLGLI